MKPHRREVELHTPEWGRCAEAVRREIGLGPGTDADIEQRLSRYGRQRTAALVREAFRGLERHGVPGRYLEYFAGCSVSHFGPGWSLHRLPRWLAARLRRIQDLEDPLPPGRYRLGPLYGDRVDFPPESALLPGEIGLLSLWNARPVEDSPEWGPASLPFAFEIEWPYEVPSALGAATVKQFKEELLNKLGIHTSWVYVGRFVALVGDRWQMLPFRLMELARPVSLAAAYGLPEDTPVGIWPTLIPTIPGAGSAAQPEGEEHSAAGRLLPTEQVAYAIRLDNPAHPGRPLTSFRSLGELRPFVPRLLADPVVPKEEQVLLRQWKELIDYLAVHPALRERRGRPRSNLAPVRPFQYPDVVAMLYRAELMEWARERSSEARPEPRPTEQERKRLWENAKRQARRVVPKEQRTELPPDLRARVEAEEPWREAWRSTGLGGEEGRGR